MAYQEEKERQQRLKDMMMMDLGTARREHIFTADRRSEFDRVPKSALEATRASNVRGTDANRQAEQNKDKLSAWHNAYTTVEQEETEDLNLFKDGQSHRARLNMRMEQENGPDPWEEAGLQARGGRGGRGSGRGRGGGMVGSHGRGGFGPASSSRNYAGSSSQAGLSRYPFRSRESPGPNPPALTAPAPSRGGSGGPMRATSRPLPNLMLGNHQVTRAPPPSHPSPSPSMQSRTQSKPRGGKVSSSWGFNAEAQLNAALKLADELAQKGAKPGASIVETGTQSYSNLPKSQASNRLGLQLPPMDRRPRAQSPRPIPGKSFSDMLASSDDFMAAAARLRGPASQAAKVPPAKASPSTDQSKATAPVQRTAPEHTLAAAPTVVAPPAPSATETRSHDDLRDVRPIPRVRLPEVIPRPVVTFSASRSQASTTSHVEQERTQPPHPQPPQEIQALSPQELQDDDDLIDFDQEDGVSTNRQLNSAVWTDPDHGILDLDNDELTAEPILPSSSVAVKTHPEDESISQELPNIMDAPVDRNELGEDIKKLSSLLSHLSIDPGNAEMVSLQAGFKKALAKLTMHTVGKKMDQDETSSAKSSSVVEGTVHGVPKVSQKVAVSGLPAHPMKSYDENAVASLEHAVAALRDEENARKDATKTRGNKIPASTFSFGEAPKPTPESAQGEVPVVPFADFGAAVAPNEYVQAQLNTTSPAPVYGPTPVRSSTPDPLPPGRSLYHNHHFPQLPNDDPLKREYVFDSGLKLAPVIVGEHLLPGHDGIPRPRSSTASSSKPFKPAPTYHPTPEPATTTRPATNIFGERLLPGHKADPPKAEHKADPPKVEQKTELPKVERKADMPKFEQKVEARVAVRDPGPIFGNRLLPAHGTKTQTQHPMEIDRKGKVKPVQGTEKRHTDSQPAKAKYSAEKLLGVGTRVASSDFDTSGFKNNPLEAMKEIKRTVSTHMLNRHHSQTDSTQPSHGGAPKLTIVARQPSASLGRNQLRSTPPVAAGVSAARENVAPQAAPAAPVGNPFTSFAPSGTSSLSTEFKPTGSAKATKGIQASRWASAYTSPPEPNRPAFNNEGFMRRR